MLRKPCIVAAACSAALAAVPITGCQSPWVQATILNNEDTPVNLVEVNYPGGSFGVQNIAPHGKFTYRFHILSNDPVEVDFTDAAGREEKIKGPKLDQGEEGTLTIEIRAGDKVVWTTGLHPRQ